MSRFFRTFGLLTILFGCATAGYRVEKLEYPLKSIQKAVSENLPNGLGRISQNRREFKSRYFLAHEYDKSYRDEKVVYRGEAHVIVLGDRRPYSIVVKVRVDRRVSGGPNKKNTFTHKDLQKGQWQVVGTNESLEKKVGDSIFDYLVRTSRKKNLIDDFRAF